MTEPVKRSAIICVDWGASGVRERTTAIELTRTSMFVLTEALPPVGAEVDLDLRFARQEPIFTRGRVTQVRLSLAPGAPAGFAVTFADDGVARRRIEALVREPRPRRAPPRSLRVLHVEKNALLRDMFAYAMTRYLEARDLRVELVQVSGLEGAVSAVQGRRFDAVLVDQDAEGARGDEIVRRVRALAGEDTWLLGIGTDGVDGRRRMLAGGADVYLRKPLVLKDLLYSIELLFQEEDPNDGVGLGAA